VLPLTDADKETLRTALTRIPEGVGSTGLYICERKSERGVVVTVYSLNGSRFNRLLTLLLQHRLGSKAQVRYNDFVIRIHRAGKKGAGERVANAVREIQGMGPEEIGSLLPLPPAERWRFARALPEPSFREMALSDHYHLEDFTDFFREMIVTVLSVPLPALRQEH
jgi:hypothetical protein